MTNKTQLNIRGGEHFYLILPVFVHVTLLRRASCVIVLYTPLRDHLHVHRVSILISLQIPRDFCVLQLPFLAVCFVKIGCVVSLLISHCFL